MEKAETTKNDQNSTEPQNIDYPQKVEHNVEQKGQQIVEKVKEVKEEVKKINGESKQDSIYASCVEDEDVNLFKSCMED